jgi:hypothetical protein
MVHYNNHKKKRKKKERKTNQTNGPRERLGLRSKILLLQTGFRRPDFFFSQKAIGFNFPEEKKKCLPLLF